MDEQNSHSDDGETAADVGALVAAAKATMAQHGPIDALQLWQEIRERFPHLPTGPVGYAEALAEAGRLDEAEGFLVQTIHQFPNDPLPRIHYAQLAAKRPGDWMEALRRWVEVRNRFPENPAGHIGLAEASKEAGRLHAQCLELMRLLEPHRAEGFQKARFGSAHDGGYVMVNDFDEISAAFSFGIAQDANWDAAVADRGVPVYQFDHTIDAPPISRPDLIFTKARIVAEPTEGGETIDQLARRHGSPGKASLILKIDIEGDEWAVFDSASEAALSCFSQIMGEFHFLVNIMMDPELYQRALRVFKKLTRNFAVVHVHATNGYHGQGVHSIANVMVPHLLEITFANRHRYSLGVTDEIFPGPLDTPSDPGLPDVHLGRFMY